MPHALSPASRKVCTSLVIVLLDRADREVAIGSPGRRCRRRCCPRTRRRGSRMPVPSPARPRRARARGQRPDAAWCTSRGRSPSRMSSPLTGAVAVPSGTGIASRFAPGRRARRTPPTDRCRRSCRTTWNTAQACEEAPERALEAGRLLAQVRGRRVDVAVGVDGPVEHHRAVVLREEARVRRAEEGAVGEAEVVQLLVAHGRADAVHVTRDVGRRDVRQDALVEVDAALHVGLVLGQQRLDVEVLGRRERLRVEALRLLVDLAVDRRRALADAARIEGDEVEAGR